MSFYVQRMSPEGRQGWTGPIRTLKQATREVQAWTDAGWQACALESTPTLRKEVNDWQRSRRASA